MAAKDIIKKYIENWKCAPGNLKGSFVFQVLIIGIFLAGFCSDHWLESFTVVSEYEYRSQGLWRFCYDSQGITCCGYINAVMYIEPFLHATRAFLVMSLISQVLCLRGVFCGIIRYRRDKILAVNCEVYNGVLSAFLIILAVIIYGSASQDEDATSLYNLSWSYALCTASGLLYIPLSCIILSTKDPF